VPCQRRHLDNPAQWLNAYTATYIERDVRQVPGASKLSLFHLFVLTCAARTGQLLNLFSLAADCQGPEVDADAPLDLFDLDRRRGLLRRHVVHHGPTDHRHAPDLIFHSCTSMRESALVACEGCLAQE
jgi:hypothetical protein